MIFTHDRCVLNYLQLYDSYNYTVSQFAARVNSLAIRRNMDALEDLYLEGNQVLVDRSDF